jgi:hypothetical protein
MLSMACPHARLRHSRFVHTESRAASLVFQAFALLYMDTGVSLIYYVLDILSVKMVSHPQPTPIHNMRKFKEKYSWIFA